MYQRILVPIDGDNASQPALQEAIKLAQHFSSKLHLVYVLDELNFINPEAYVDFEALRVVQREAGERILDRAVRDVRQAGIEAESGLLNTLLQNIEDSIDAEAVRWGADLIVMGTHGRSGLGRMMFGSIADGVVRHAPVPVLLVHTAT